MNANFLKGRQHIFTRFELVWVAMLFVCQFYAIFSVGRHMYLYRSNRFECPIYLGHLFQMTIQSFILLAIFQYRLYTTRHRATRNMRYSNDDDWNHWVDPKPTVYLCCICSCSFCIWMRRIVEASICTNLIWNGLVLYTSHVLGDC